MGGLAEDGGDVFYWGRVSLCTGEEEGVVGCGSPGWSMLAVGCGFGIVTVVVEVAVGGSGLEKESRDVRG